MSPNIRWHCGNHIPVHVVDNITDKNDFTIAFGCKRWRKITPEDLSPGLLPNKWRCGHKNPTHIANNEAEKLALTREKKCKNWRVVFNP